MFYFMLANIPGKFHGQSVYILEVLKGGECPPPQLFKGLKKPIAIRVNVIIISHNKQPDTRKSSLAASS